MLSPPTYSHVIPDTPDQIRDSGMTTRTKTKGPDLEIRNKIGCFFPQSLILHHFTFHSQRDFILHRTLKKRKKEMNPRHPGILRRKNLSSSRNPAKKKLIVIPESWRRRDIRDPITLCQHQGLPPAFFPSQISLLSNYF